MFITAVIASVLWLVLILCVVIPIILCDWRNNQRRKPGRTHTDDREQS